MKARVQIIPTGAANLASVLAGMARLGLEAQVTDDPDAVRHGPGVVLPGVGAFGPAAQRLHGSGLGRALRERIDADRPTLCVCLGMQLLCRASEEAPGVPGLGVIPASVSRFPASAGAVPQMGWNRLEASPGCRLLTSGSYYFANSYRVVEPPAGWHAAVGEYGGPFVGAIERGRVLACQFHPELSGPLGAGVLRRWAELVEAQAC